MGAGRRGLESFKNSGVWDHHNPALRHIEVGSEAIVKGGHELHGLKVKVTRVDKHAYPICANYTRFKPEQLHFVKAG